MPSPPQPLSTQFTKDVIINYLLLNLCKTVKHPAALLTDSDERKEDNAEKDAGEEPAHVAGHVLVLGHAKLGHAFGAVAHGEVAREQAFGAFHQVRQSPGSFERYRFLIGREIYVIFF